MHLIVPFSVVFLLILALLLYQNKLSIRFSIVLACILLFSTFYTQAKTPIPDDLSKIQAKTVSLMGRVVSLPQFTKNKRSQKFEFHVTNYKTTADWQATDSKTLLYVSKRDFDKEIGIGDRLELSAKLKKPKPATNPGQFDYKGYLNNKRIFTTGFTSTKYITKIQQPQGVKWVIVSKINHLRQQILRTHSKYLKSPNLEILGSIVFGRYAAPTSDDVRKDFTNAGLIHLLCASGLNVGLIYTIWFFSTRKLFRFPYKVAIISGGLLVLFYALMTGLPPSIQRATLMLEFILIGKLIDRQADNVALLALICSILLLIDPLSITNVGFQLSFMVTLGLLLFVPTVIEKIKTIPKYLSGLIVVPIIAQAWAIPLTLFHFNTFAVFSVISNILVVPFISIICFGGFMASLVSLYPLHGEQICGFIDSISNVFVDYLAYISHSIGQNENALQLLPTPDIVSIIAYYLFLFILIFQIKNGFENKRTNIILTILPIIVACSFIGHNYFKDLNIVFLDVGEGDAIYIHTPKGKHILVDTGRYDKYTPAKNVILPYLHSRGIEQLDLLVLTHPDSDHIGGALDIINNIRVTKIIDNGTKTSSRLYERLYSLIKDKDITLVSAPNNYNINIDKSMGLTVLKPDNTIKNNNNEDSIILKLERKGLKALLMGDNETNSYSLLKKNIEGVNILKVGHHGSKRSINQKMIDLLHPQNAVISVGTNRYGHPSKKVLDLLKDNNINTYRTDRDNAVKVEIQGNTLKTYAYNNLMNRWDFHKKN